eukprot:scaffold29567_cov80-Skeletonema_marinoi.AAC.1
MRARADYNRSLGCNCRQQTPTMDTFNDEVPIVLGLLTPEDLMRSRVVCSNWREAVTKTIVPDVKVNSMRNTTPWSPWREHFQICSMFPFASMKMEGISSIHFTTLARSRAGERKQRLRNIQKGFRMLGIRYVQLLFQRLLPATYRN